MQTKQVELSQHEANCLVRYYERELGRRTMNGHNLSNEVTDWLTEESRNKIRKFKKIARELEDNSAFVTEDGTPV